MQELIERLDKEINSKYPDGYNIVMEIAKDLTEQMLEKEKEVMCEFQDKAQYTDFWVKYDGADDCFEQTFKTKEK